MKRTLITITGPSAAGKTHLFDYGKQSQNINTLVSTTSRAPRVGETHGVTYYYTDKETMRLAKDSGSLIECNAYNGEFYGVTKQEFFGKLEKGPVFAIVEPEGIKTYSAACKELDVNLVKVFITVPLKDRINRFITRFHCDVLSASPEKLTTTTLGYIERLRLMSTYEEDWINSQAWDLILDGTVDPKTNLEKIKNHANSLESIH